jgi:outer membrane protein OmpA-like peptidoglycan-associated protein
VSALNDSDSYALYVYKYSGQDFCKKLYNKLIQPLQKPMFFGSDFKKYTSVNQIQAYPEDVFYVSVMSISSTNCGHELKMWYNTQDTLNVNARHYPCKIDVLTAETNFKKHTVKNPPVADVKPLKDTVIPVTKKIENPVEITKIISKDSIKHETPIHQNNSLIEKPSSKQFTITAYDVKKINLSISLTKLFVIDTQTNAYIPFEKATDTIWVGELFPGKQYSIKANAFGYKDSVFFINKDYPELIKLWMQPLKVGDNFIMKSIYFHPNTYALKKESTEELRRLYQYLLQNPETKIEIQGHTNGNNKIAFNKAYSTFGEEWNFKGSSKNLSLKRAEKIKAILVENGISAERLNPVGIGGDKPIIQDAETIDQAQKNIRVEVVILSN